MVTAEVLHGVRVLDLRGEAGQFCGKLLGDFGTDVIKIAPPRGRSGMVIGAVLRRSRRRRPQPLLACHEHQQAYDAPQSTDRAGARPLAASPANCAIVLEIYTPGTPERWGYGFATRHRQSPQRILTSITPLGQIGPCCHLRATELELLALGGGPGRLRRSGSPATLGRSLAEMTRLQGTGVVA